MTEEWRSLVGYEGKLEISDLGRIRSIARVVPKSDGSSMRIRGRIRKLKLDKRGYPRLSLNGKDRDIIVHQAVLAAFVGPCPPGLEVRHADGDSGNPTLGNLSYSTHAENLRDMWKHGTAPIGEKCVTAKLTEAQVREILAIGKSQSLSQIAARYPVSFGHVSSILNGHKWKHLHQPAGG